MFNLHFSGNEREILVWSDSVRTNSSLWTKVVFTDIVMKMHMNAGLCLGTGFYNEVFDVLTIKKTSSRITVLLSTSEYCICML